MNKNTFNIMVLGDIHFGKKNDSKLYSDLQEYFLNYIPNFEKEYGKLGMIVIAGDLFDRIIKMSETPSNYVLKFVESLCNISTESGVYLRIIKGTKGHDFNQLNNFLHLEAKNPLFKIINTREKETIEWGDYFYNILYLPEEYPEDYNKYYKGYLDVKKDEDKYDFIFGHGMMDFVAFTGDENILRKIKRNEAVHKADNLCKICNYYTVFGHIHDMKEYRDKIYYTGSFERFSFADQEDKGFIAISINPDDDYQEIMFVENENASSYFVLNLDEYEFEDTESKLTFIEECKSKYNYVKVIVPENEKNKELLKKIVSSEVSIQIKNSVKEEIVDERYRDIVERKLPVDQSIAKFIYIDKGKKVPLTTINKIIAKEN